MFDDEGKVAKRERFELSVRYKRTQTFQVDRPFRAYTLR